MLHTTQRVIYLAAVVSLSALAGCGVETKTEFPVDDVTGKPLGRGETPEPGLFGSSGIFGGSDSGAGGDAQLPVNKYLWRATLDTLAFLPLSSTDPYGGVIVTDWGATPQTPNERFKVSAYITSAVLKPQSLRVVVNKQARDAGGQWVAAPVAATTARQLENAILTRARQIKIEAGDSD